MGWGGCYGKGKAGGYMGKGVSSWAAPSVQKPWIKQSTPPWSAGPCMSKGMGGSSSAKGALSSMMSWGKGMMMKGKGFDMKGKGKGKGKPSPPRDDPFWATKMEQENRQVMDGAFSGTVFMYNVKQGWGFIKPDNVDELPLEVQAKLTEQAAATLEKGKEAESVLYFRKPDMVDGFKAIKDCPVSFSVYIDDKGAGATDVTG
mmetsp:Transcript_63502/g.163432  ORF Transcript_63502/g.163432 Transcript_63502/m.163432 type:complete len:202 (-) Transcript_63502:173-778(-)